MKTTIEDLALFGGPPVFEEPLHVGRPNVGDRQRLAERFDQMLDRRWLTNDGPLVLEFERRIADLAGVRHCVATCNATAALELAIRGLGLTGEVIVPAFTFVAPVHALTWHGLTPVFCDIDPATHLMDPDRIEALVTPRTSAVLGVHLWGRSCDVDRLGALADRHGLSLIYDAAHAMGCADQGRPIGGCGQAEIFSFHATKVVNAFEGGALVTGDTDLANRIRRLRNFGFVDTDLVEGLGVNAKMPEASAAMGLTSLESLDEFIEINRRHYARYHGRLAGLPGVRMWSHAEMLGTNYHYVVVEIDGDAAGIDRDLLFRGLTAERVLARRYFYPGCHRMEPYRTLDGAASHRLPHTERVCAQVLQLPTGTAVGAADIDAVCELVEFIAANGDRIRERVARQEGEPT